MSDADASLPLQKAIIDKLKGTTAVTNIVAQRVFTRVTPGAAKPYISLGPFDVLPEQIDEGDGSETSIQIDGWSASPETKEVMSLGRAIRTALDEAELTLVDNQRLVSFDIEQTRYFTDPDGLTQHAVVTFTARTEPSA